MIGCKQYSYMTIIFESDDDHGAGCNSFGKAEVGLLVSAKCEGKLLMLEDWMSNVICLKLVSAKCEGKLLMLEDW